MRRLIPLIAILAVLVPALGSRAHTQTDPSLVPLLELEGLVVERQDPLDALLSTPGSTLGAWGRSIDRAARDRRVPALVVRVGWMDIGLAQAQELRAHMTRFRESGKELHVLLEDTGLLSFYLASAGDRVVMSPASTLDVHGLSIQLYYFRDLLDKIGVSFQGVHTGRFKDALSPFVDREATEGTREQLEAVLDVLDDAIITAIATGRGMEPDDARDVLYSGPLSARAALDAGLVTDLIPLADYLRGLENRNAWEFDTEYSGDRPASPVAEPSFMDFFSIMSGTRPAARPVRRTNDTIAVVYAMGPIVDGEDPSDFLFGGQQVIASATFARLLDDIETENQALQAVVLRLDSPGGSATASDVIWNELMSLRQRLNVPLVVSMGNTAASGGYYIACAGDKIVAQPMTVTGSIGVIGARIVMGDLYSKIGINTTRLSRGENAGIWDETRAWDERETALFEGLIDEMYELFLARIAEGRNVAIDDIRPHAEGRVWMGVDAHRLGLVDELGGLARAIEIAREMSESPRAELVTYPREMNLFEFLESIMSRGLGVRSGNVSALPGGPALEAALALLPARARATLLGGLVLARPEPTILTWHPLVLEVR